MIRKNLISIRINSRHPNHQKNESFQAFLLCLVRDSSSIQ